MNDHTHNTEAERGALAIILDGRMAESWTKLVDAIATPAAFYVRDHRIVALACTGLAAEGDPINAGSVAQWLTEHTWGELYDQIKELDGEAVQRNRPKSNDGPAYEDSALAAIGGFNAVAELGSAFVNSQALPRLAATIAKHHRQRLALGTATRLVDALRGPTGVRKCEELVERTVEDLLAIESPDRGVATLADGVDRALARHDAIRDHTTTIKSASWGIDTLDERCPLDPGTLTTLAAAPGAGKTSLLLHAIEATARRHGPGSVALVSREMGVAELAAVILARRLRVPRRLIDCGRLDGSQRNQASEVRGEVESWNAWIRDGMECSAKDACAWARSHFRSSGGRLALLAVDHVGILSKSHPRQNDYEKITEASGMLKSLARVLQIPVLILSQMSRDGRKAERDRSGQLRPDPEPQLSDLRGSGSLEQDSDNVLFLYRPSLERIPGGGWNVTGKTAKARAVGQSRTNLQFHVAEGQRFASDEARTESHPDLQPGSDDKPPRAHRMAADPSLDPEPPF